MRVELELQEVEQGNIHRIIRKQYTDKGKLKSETSVGYINSRLADLVNFDDREY